MQLIVKVGNKLAKDNLNFLKMWRDGQIVEFRPSGTPVGGMEARHFCIIETPTDYWSVRGSTDLKSTKSSALTLKKEIVPVDRQGKYSWEFGYIEETRLRCRDKFVDFKHLLDMGWITISDFESIYDKSKPHNDIYIDRPLEEYLFHEDVKTRLVSQFSDNLGTVSAGTFEIGPSATTPPGYLTLTTFEADIAATLTGNLTAEHLNEESVITNNIVFDTDTNGFLLKLTAASGAEHTGATYGNGARISYGTFDRISFDETNDGDLDDVEISNLALDATGTGNWGVVFADGADAGSFLANRLLIAGDSGSEYGIRCDTAALNVNVRNCTIYGVSAVGTGRGLFLRGGTSGITYTIYNNTISKCIENFRQHDGSLNATLTTKNNIAQGGTTSDFADGGGGYGTTAKNLSEDATSPDATYRSINLHDATSNFVDYANNDYRLIAGGSELTTLDDGDDLSGIFTDDIIGTIRSIWYMGAFELVVAGGNDGAAMYHHLQTLGVY